MAEKLNPTDKANVRKMYLREDFPYVYAISIARNKCTIKCRMCPMYTMPPDDLDITDEIMNRALDPIGDRKLNLEVSAFGEPFLHPKCDEYMFLTRKRAPNAEIVFVTNGTLLKKERCEKIVDSGIDIIQVSLDAGSPETYKWLTGSKNYDRVCRDLEQLAEIRNKRGGKHLNIQTHIIGVRELEHEFDDFVEKWSGIVDQAVVREYGNWGGRTDHNEVTPAKEEEIPAERYPCAWPWYATKIEPNGDVVKCHQHTIAEKGDNERLGSLLEDDFLSIWQGENMRRVRNKLLKNDHEGLGYCKDCNVWSLFYDVWEKEKLLGFVPTGRWK